MVSFQESTRKRVGFDRENDEKIASEPEEDVNQAAENSKGSFEIDVFINSLNSHVVNFLNRSCLVF